MRYGQQNVPVIHRIYPLPRKNRLRASYNLSFFSLFRALSCYNHEDCFGIFLPDAFEPRSFAAEKFRELKIWTWSGASEEMAAMKLKEIISIIDGIAPFDLAEPWDHSGLRLGSAEDEIRALAVCLDPTADAVAKAAELGCNLLVTHHPLMFSPQENMICDRPDTKAVAAAFSLGVNILSCHTNLDSARGGINDCLASLAGLSDVEPLIPSQDPRGFGMGAIGSVAPCGCAELCGRVASAWNLSGYRLIESAPTVQKAALCGGAGGSLWKDAAAKGAGLYITADLRYHECLEAVDAGLSLMICDHGEMENPPLRPFSETLRNAVGLPVHFMDLVTPKRLRERWRGAESNVSN